MDRAVGFVLVAVHIVLGLWAVVGFIEWFAATPPWPRISNPNFPRGILFLQWTLSLSAAALFLAGYARRWSKTPVAMAAVYGAMALFCAVQTFGYMHGTQRFVALGAEYLAYVSILVILFRWRRFSPGAVGVGWR